MGAIALLENGAPMRGKVVALENVMRTMPQAELETQHYFADNMYMRVVPRKAGTVVIGKVHKKEHFYVVATGRVRVTTDEGVNEYEGLSIIVSKPGTKRAVLALEDSICLTVHRTKKKNLAKIEQELIEPDVLALFDSGNKRRALK